LIVGTGINFIDLSGAEMLASEGQRLSRLGGGLYFAELKSSVYEFVSKNYLVKKLGNSHFFDTKKHAIAGIYKKLDREVCKKCDARVFKECNW
jgi:SulP family sulfate permease